MARDVSLDRARLLAIDHNFEIRRITQATAQVVKREWDRLDRDNIDRSWQTDVGPQVTAAVELGQTRAAELADDYLDEITNSSSSWRVNPQALTGLAADGRDLDTLLRTPVVATKTALSRRYSSPQAFAIGGRALQLIGATETADAARVADGVALAARQDVKGYVRLLSGTTSCPRCAILAGRFYRWNAGFERHPQCLCTHVPVGDSLTEDSLLTDPMAAYRAGRVHGLSEADRHAIEDGADMASVVNAHRGMYTAGGRKFTNAGSHAWTLRGRKPRMRPETIYKEAGSREEAISWLEFYGYIV